MHNSLSNCRRETRQRRHDAASEPSVKSKNGVLPRKTVPLRTNALRPLVAPASLILALVCWPGPSFLRAQEQTITEEGYEREELGVNRYTAPPIARIFRQLDELKPLPFDQINRDHQRPIRGSRDQMALVFGGLIADGFLLVACEKKAPIDELGRALLRQAQSLSVADCVTRHSASLTELAKHGDWSAMRIELAATQEDVEQAMIELRDQKVAHLISLGGWLRGLEICAAAVEADFSPARARLLSQPDVIDYFAGEIKTLPPIVAHSPLFQKIRAQLSEIRRVIDSTLPAGLGIAEVTKIHNGVRELNREIETTH